MDRDPNWPTMSKTCFTRTTVPPEIDPQELRMAELEALADLARRADHPDYGDYALN